MRAFDAHTVNISDMFAKIMTYMLDGIVALAKVSVAPIIAFLLVAFAVGMLDYAGGDERVTLLAACLAMFVATISNAAVFWHRGSRYTALIGGGLWIAYALACLLTVLAFWGG